MTIREKILRLFETQTELSVKEITDKLMVSKQMAHLVLNALLSEGLVIKLGHTKISLPLNRF